MNYIKAAAFDLIFLLHNVLYNHWLRHPLGPSFLLTQALGAVPQSSVEAEFDPCFALKIDCHLCRCSPLLEILSFEMLNDPKNHCL